MGDWDSRFREIAAGISAALATSRPGHDDHRAGLVIEELGNIACFPSLWHDATIGLQARSERRPLLAVSEQGGG